MTTCTVPPQDEIRAIRKAARLSAAMCCCSPKLIHPCSPKMVHFWNQDSTRISQQLSTAAVDPGMSTALRSVGLLDVLSSTPAEPSVARLVSMPGCTASSRNLVRKAG